MPSTGCNFCLWTAGQGNREGPGRQGSLAASGNARRTPPVIPELPGQAPGTHIRQIGSPALMRGTAPKRPLRYSFSSASESPGRNLSSE